MPSKYLCLWGCNEAANASLMLERLCKQYGVSADIVDQGYDPERDEVEMRCLYRGKRLDRAEGWVLTSVVKFYNGRIIEFKTNVGTTLKIFASKGNQVQIELYFDYIMEIMTKLANKAKADNPYSPRSFKADYRKGFALTIYQRLREMKKVKCQDAGDSGEGLVVADRDARELAAVNEFVSEALKGVKLVTAPKHSYVVRSGVSMGSNAARNVGLNTQVAGGASRLLA